MSTSHIVAQLDAEIARFRSAVAILTETPQTEQEESVVVVVGASES